jgi:hypothetical protein
MKKNLLPMSASAVFALFLVGSPAGAATITLGLQEAGFNSGLITNEGTATGSISTGAGSYGTFTVNNISGIGNPALLPLTDLLNGASSNVSTATPGVMNVYVTSQGNTLFTGAQTFLSSFTSNTLAGGLKVTETTFLDTANGLWTGTADAAHPTVHQLGQAAFSDIGIFLASLGLNPGSLYSITEVFTIDATHVLAGGGNAQSTIDVSVSPVPIPGALPLFASGILGLVVLGRKRKKQKLESAIA